MSYTMEDFKRELTKKYFKKLSPEEQQEVLRSLPPENRLAGLSPEQIRRYVDQLTTGRATAVCKPRRKK